MEFSVPLHAYLPTGTLQGSSSSGSSNSAEMGLVCASCTAPLRRLFAVLFACIVLWLGCAVLFYHAVEGWDATHALFFAVNVGFGIGYGFPDCAHAACAWYTSAHCVFGASFVMGALLLGFNLPLEWQRRQSAEAALRRWQQLGGGRGGDQWHKRRTRRGAPRPQAMRKRWSGIIRLL
jgi:hypothetical protein